MPSQYCDIRFRELQPLTITAGVSRPARTWSRPIAQDLHLVHAIFTRLLAWTWGINIKPPFDIYRSSKINHPFRVDTTLGPSYRRLPGPDGMSKALLPVGLIPYMLVACFE